MSNSEEGSCPFSSETDSLSLCSAFVFLSVYSLELSSHISILLELWFMTRIKTKSQKVCELCFAFGTGLAFSLLVHTSDFYHAFSTNYGSLHTYGPHRADMIVTPG